MDVLLHHHQQHELATDRPVAVNVTLTPVGTISGKVTEADGTIPPSGSYVSVD